MLRKSLFLYLSLFVSFLPLASQAQIDGGTIEGVNKRTEKAIAIRSTDSKWQLLAEKAFSTHGGFRIVKSGQPSVILVINPAGGNQASLAIEGGSSGKVLFSSTVTGDSPTNALLRACDLAVLKTIAQPGYFAGKLAFVADRSGKREIWSGDLFFQNIAQLTGHNSNSINPHWSPDGNKLLYTSYFRSGFPDIMQMDVASRRISTFAAYKGTNSGGAYSPDGSKVAMILSPTGNSELYVSSSSGGKPTRLTNGRGVESSPAWSPDSRQIVYTSDERGGPQIYIIPATGGKPRYLNTRMSRYIDEPDWNPRDPNKILFTAASGGGYQIGMINLSTNKAGWLTKAGNNSEACWLNDGRHIVYVQKNGRWSGLRIFDTETGKDTALHSSSFGNAWQPDFVYPR